MASLGSGIIVEAILFKENLCNGYILQAIRKQVRELTGELPTAVIAEAIGDESESEGPKS